MFFGGGSGEPGGRGWAVQSSDAFCSVVREQVILSVSDEVSWEPDVGVLNEPSVAHQNLLCLPWQSTIAGRQTH